MGPRRCIVGITSGVFAAALAAGMSSACSLDVTGSLAGSQGEVGTTTSSGGTGSSTSTSTTGTATGSTTGGVGGAGGAGGAGGVGGGSVCGNGAVEPGEECDDGSTIAADGCSPACAIETIDTCPGAAVSLMPSMPSMLTIPGDLTGKANDTRGTCGGSDSPDLVYAVTPSATGTLNLVLDGSFNKTLYVRTECASNAASGQLACVNGMAAQALSLWVEVGKTYYVFVDGKASDKGLFTLTLALLPT